MKKFHLNHSDDRLNDQPDTFGSSSNGQIFYFCEKDTGAVRFCVVADDAGRISEDHAAGLLAMQCMTHGLAPQDYMILVPARGASFERVTTRAAELLEAGRSISTPVQLSGREREVLDGILNNLLNKEIAADLNISERTVKFHVSSLLAKFNVRSRFELIQVAHGNRSPRSTPVENKERFGFSSLRLLPA